LPSKVRAVGLDRPDEPPAGPPAATAWGGELPSGRDRAAETRELTGTAMTGLTTLAVRL